MSGKIYYIGMTLALLVAGCTADNKEEPTPQPEPLPVVEPTQEDTPIAFNAQVSDLATTRTGPTPVYGDDRDDVNHKYNFEEGYTAVTQLNNPAPGFGVFAVYTGNTAFADAANAKTYERQLVMKNQQVTSTNGTTWTYSPARYWPGNESKISFFAYAPYQNSCSYPVALDIGTDGEGNTYLKSTDEDRTFKAPSVPYTWSHTDPKDLLWGTVNKDTYDINNILIKSKGQDYTDMRRPGDATLRWNFKHALARVRFTMSNYMTADKLFSNVGSIGFTNAITQRFTLNGDEDFYISFTDESPSHNTWHKFQETVMKLMITNVTLEGFYGSGDLVPMNDELNNAIWENQVQYQDNGGNLIKYNLAPINPNVYVDLSGVTINTVNGVNLLTGAESTFSGLNNIWTEDEKGNPQPIPLNMALEYDDVNDVWVEDEDKTHYLLLIPQYFDANTATNNIKVTVSYRIFTKVQLEGNYLLENSEFTRTGDYSSANHAALMYIASGSQDTEQFGYIASDLMPNKQYTIEIKLGKVMGLLFEVTDWDDKYVIDIPEFE